MQKHRMLGVFMATFTGSLSSGAPLALGQEFTGFDDVSYAGSACPGGSLVNSFTPDEGVLTLQFNPALVSPLLGFKGQRKNCAIMLQPASAAGWSVGLAEVSVGGWLELVDGSTARLEVAAHFQGEPDSLSAGSVYSQAQSGPLAFTQLIPADAISWSSCSDSRALIINTAVKVSSASGEAAFAALFGEQAPLSIRVVYRRCPLD